MPDLKLKWQALKERHPRMTARDAARELGVSEAQLVASRCGDGVCRLAGPWPDLVRLLGSLGPVMALTRSEGAVHEKVCRFDDLALAGLFGIVRGPTFDLRMDFDRWRFGFAVTAETRGTVKTSLQFFDAGGTAVHKVFPRAPNHGPVLAELVERFRHPDQTPGMPDPTLGKGPVRNQEGDLDWPLVRAHWNALLEPGGTASEAGESMPPPDTGARALREVGNDSFRLALEEAAGRALPITLVVASPGVVQAQTDTIRKLKPTPHWFNVLDPGFNLHLREDQIARTWLATVPAPEGAVTSIEIFDAAGGPVASLTGDWCAAPGENQAWQAFADAL